MRCGKPQKARLYIGRKSGDLFGDGFVQDFDPPGHAAYISFLR
jgi:hypothetical protein